MACTREFLKGDENARKRWFEHTRALFGSEILEIRQQ